MPKKTTTFNGVRGLNCHGEGHFTTYTISGGTKGTVEYNVTALNNGEPIHITDVRVVHDAYDSKDSFYFYFVSTDKIYEEGMTTAGGYESVFKQPTLDYFNGLLVNNCWTDTKTVIEHCEDATPSGGSVSIVASAQKLQITWWPYAEWLAETTTQAGLITKYYDGTQWVQVK